MSASIHKTELAYRVVDAVVRGDFGTFMSLFSVNGRVWRNFDNREISLKDNLPILKRISANCRLLYEEVRIFETKSGWIQLHDLRAIYADGSECRVPSCQVFRLGADGKIARLEEYLDGAQLMALGTTPAGVA
ncbi:hypothetical protein P3H15_39345 [Rhodococcus sp. T2V]|uniref:hypothetical protein n=1 Tax=Rhodococcus sp. T2V TaxID=3034164 RepID=UPI0023E1526A|nr:hypothetical protein [Rhodococcus sp. T2V]MDF3311057.1 hypothetical protein [Rhodococcus sp. T2V]